MLQASSAPASESEARRAELLEGMRRSPELAAGLGVRAGSLQEYLENSEMLAQFWSPVTSSTSDLSSAAAILPKSGSGHDLGAPVGLLEDLLEVCREAPEVQRSGMAIPIPESEYSPAPASEVADNFLFSFAADPTAEQSPLASPRSELALELVSLLEAGGGASGSSTAHPGTMRSVMSCSATESLETYADAASAYKELQDLRVEVQAAADDMASERQALRGKAEAALEAKAAAEETTARNQRDFKMALHLKDQAADCLQRSLKEHREQLAQRLEDLKQERAHRLQVETLLEGSSDPPQQESTFNRERERRLEVEQLLRQRPSQEDFERERDRRLEVEHLLAQCPDPRRSQEELKLERGRRLEVEQLLRGRPSQEEFEQERARRLEVERLLAEGPDPGKLQEELKFERARRLEVEKLIRERPCQEDLERERERRLEVERLLWESPDPSKLQDELKMERARRLEVEQMIRERPSREDFEQQREQRLEAERLLAERPDPGKLEEKLKIERARRQEVEQLIQECPSQESFEQERERRLELEHLLSESPDPGKLQEELKFERARRLDVEQMLREQCNAESSECKLERRRLCEADLLLQERSADVTRLQGQLDAELARRPEVQRFIEDLTAEVTRLQGHLASEREHRMEVERHLAKAPCSAGSALPSSVPGLSAQLLCSSPPPSQASALPVIYEYSGDDDTSRPATTRHGADAFVAVGVAPDVQRSTSRQNHTPLVRLDAGTGAAVQSMAGTRHAQPADQSLQPRKPVKEFRLPDGRVVEATLCSFPR